MKLIFVLQILQIIISVVLCVCILLQAGGSGALGGLGAMTGLYRSKRGFEKIVFSGTIVFAILFVLNSLLLLVIK